MGVIVYLGGVAMMLLVGAMVSMASAEEVQGMLAEAQQSIDLQRQVYGQGSWAQATVQRLSEFGTSMGALLISGPEVLGMFLLGSWFAGSGALATPERFPRLYASLRWIALPLGLLVRRQLMQEALQAWCQMLWPPLHSLCCICGRCSQINHSGRGPSAPLRWRPLWPQPIHYTGYADANRPLEIMRRLP